MTRPAWCRAAALGILLTLTVGPGVSAAFADTPDPRFKVPRDQLLSRVHTIGAVPVVFAPEVASTDAIAARLDAEIASWLANAGFAVIPAQAMRDIERRAAGALGGLYDSHSGQRFQDKVDAFREYTLNEYRDSQHVDALVSAAVITRAATFRDGVADWDGVRDNLTGSSGIAGFFAGIAAMGAVSTLSLHVRLTDPSGRLLYVSAGGLQPLSFVSRSISVRGYEQFPIDPKFVLSDPVREQRAIAIAFEPLSPKPRSAISPTPIPARAAATTATRQDLLSRHRRLVLAPLALPSDRHIDQEVRARYAIVLERRLRGLGFDVVAPSDYDSIWAEEVARVGELYDPVTGRLDAARRTTAQSRAIAALRDRYEVQGLVLPAIELRAAPFSSGYAAWDGGREAVGEGLLDLSIFGAAQFAGSIQAFSLAVRVLDANSDLLYEGRGAIELAEKLYGSDGVLRQVESPLSDAKLDARAAQIALHTLDPPKSASR